MQLSRYYLFQTCFALVASTNIAVYLALPSFRFVNFYVKSALLKKFEIDYINDCIPCFMDFLAQAVRRSCDLLSHTHGFLYYLLAF